MSLSDFNKNLANAVQRQGSVFVKDGSSYRDLGQVKNVEISFEPVSTEADTAGRVKQLGMDIVFTFVMQQTSDQELAALDALAAIGTTNGITLKVTNSLSNAAGAAAADGVEIVNCLPNISGTLNFGGEESMMTVEVRGRVSMTKFAEIGTGTLTFDA